MAQKRMFSLSVIDTDWFLDLPLTTQALYFHLALRADDDGFVDSPKSIMRKIGCNSNDFQILIAKRYILEFDSGVIVIKHWRMHNTIQKDRYIPTTFKEELSKLKLDDKKSYTEKDGVYKMDTYCIHNNISISKSNTKSNTNTINNTNNTTDNNININNKKKYGEFNNVALTDDEIEKLKNKFPNDWQQKIENLSSYLAQFNKKYKSHYATILNWARKDNDVKITNNIQSFNKNEEEKLDDDLLSQFKEAIGI